MSQPVSARVLKAESSEDWRYIRQLCCDTGDAGRPIDASRCSFFSENWIGPYQKLEPESSFIVYSENQRAGYLTGCSDTRTLHSRLFLQFKLRLTLAILFGRYPLNADTRRFLRRTFKIERGPEEAFSRETTRTLLRDYPAHLHMNVASTYRSLGLGHHLVSAFKEELKRKGVRGVHLYCGEKPRQFYMREGFTEIDRIEFRPGIFVYALGAII